MRENDILILPSLEEGSALVTYEARGCGCVLLVSEATGAPCTHTVNALVHKPGDVDALTRHIRTVVDDRALLRRLRESSLRDISELTWSHAAKRLNDLYLEAV